MFTTSARPIRVNHTVSNSAFDMLALNPLNLLPAMCVSTYCLYDYDYVGCYHCCCCCCCYYYYYYYYYLKPAGR